jgi:UDP-GlcNAc:undecaprenyl-phosphate GlcNAc-1-phosphate transferase
MKTATTFAVLVPLFLFGIPLFDAGFVVIRRVLSGSPITSPDKRHVHHTLLKYGFTQKQTVWILYLVAIALSGAILFMVRQNG